MERGVGSIWCVVLLIPGLLPGCCSEGITATVGYLEIVRHLKSTLCLTSVIGCELSCRVRCLVLWVAGMHEQGVAQQVYSDHTVYTAELYSIE